jgi:hypothetical protein
MNDNFCWSGDRQGLELGLRASAHSIRSDGAVEVRFAARNNSPRVLAVAPAIALFVKRGELVEEQFGGPSFAEPMPIPPHETLELLTWRLTTDQLGAAPGPRTVWAVYRPSGAAEARTGEVTIEVTT